MGAQAQAEPMCDAAAALVAARPGTETLLTAVAEAFNEQARGMEADDRVLRLAPFDDTCALISVLFNSLGIAFKFAENEYVTKVKYRNRSALAGSHRFNSFFGTKFRAAMRRENHDLSVLIIEKSGSVVL